MSQNLSYKKAMARLDEILENIDRSELAVDELAEQVLEAAKLLKHCKKVLMETEVRVHDVLQELETEFDRGDEVEQ